MEAGRVLVAFAHPDDAEFSMGGTVARWAAGGAEVRYVCVTDGAAGDNRPGQRREDIARVREQELRTAAAILGVAGVTFLGYADGYLQVTLDLRRDLTREVRRFRPALVVAPDPSRLWERRSYINHPDHRAVGEAMLAVVNPDAPSRPQFSELLDEGHEPFEVPALWLGSWGDGADEFVDISDTIDKKIEALHAHESQIRNMGEFDVDGFVRMRAAELAEGRGMEYAEAFRTFHLIEDRAAAATAAAGGEAPGTREAAEEG